MTTFSQARSTFRELFIQLEQLQGAEKITRAMRVLKERETGKLCYQAEEDLTQAELSLLKDLLAIEKKPWELYKQIYRANVQVLLQ